MEFTVSKEFTVEKSSRYNRKRASGAHHTKCVRQIGCSSEAASGNIVKFFKVCVSQGGGWGVNKFLSRNIPTSHFTILYPVLPNDPVYIN